MPNVHVGLWLIDFHSAHYWLESHWLWLAWLNYSIYVSQSAVYIFRPIYNTSGTLFPSWEQICYIMCSAKSFYRSTAIVLGLHYSTAHGAVIRGLMQGQCLFLERHSKHIASKMRSYPKCPRYSEPLKTVWGTWCLHHLKCNKIGLNSPFSLVE